MDPKNLKYNESHEWVGLTREGNIPIGVVGLTDFAIEQLKDLTYLKLPDVGSQIARGDEFGEVESIKAVSPLYCPVSGEVIAVNEEVSEQPERLTDDAYNHGWMIKVRLTDPAELDSLLDRAAYLKLVSH